MEEREQERWMGDGRGVSWGFGQMTDSRSMRFEVLGVKGDVSAAGDCEFDFLLAFENCSCGNTSRFVYPAKSVLL